MLSIFNRKNKKLQGGESSVSSNHFLNDATESTETLVKTELSFHPTSTISTEEKYYYQFLNNELTPLKENQLSLSGIELKKIDKGYAVNAFVRSSLSKAITLQKTPLLLIDHEGERLGRKVFDFSELGELPAASSRPWVFIFEASDLSKNELPTTGWKLAFELKRLHSLDMDESWEKSLSTDEKKILEKFVQSIDPPKIGDIDFMGIQITIENDDLHVTMLIRNGTEKNLTFQEIPLIVEDATGEIVAKGGFTLESFEVKSNTSKPWTFVFPQSLLLKDNPDFSTWKAYPPNQ